MIVFLLLNTVNRSVSGLCAKRRIRNEAPGHVLALHQQLASCFISADRNLSVEAIFPFVNGRCHF